jgi:hypothetical protein
MLSVTRRPKPASRSAASAASPISLKNRKAIGEAILRLYRAEKMGRLIAAPAAATKAPSFKLAGLVSNDVPQKTTVYLDAARNRVFVKVVDQGPDYWGGVLPGTVSWFELGAAKLRLNPSER